LLTSFGNNSLTKISSFVQGRLTMIFFRIPSARSIDGLFLLMVVAMPLVAAVAAAAGIMVLGGREGGGPLTILLDVAKFCYLGVAMAHLSRGLAERTDGGLASEAWWNPKAEAQEAPAFDGEFWHRFPNHFDGAAIGLALALMLAMF